MTPRTPSPHPHLHPRLHLPSTASTLTNTTTPTPMPVLVSTRLSLDHHIQLPIHCLSKRPSPLGYVALWLRS
ncbi:hypothetical protein M431DRAFT_513673 [Trichoderma harzianum CBS 226.95]|uniref:Uncharacterized protein n=1 Tax=Trichoderma harzianum CBS 226.95 TaxID=983964 RepID=A0A2T3ZUG0_TRIHA|nr:hypothetical protein M431DRAFT_513673 [Trichoderma harzianum CBS 226.95]PTB48445.1 hypothetical protein M431DRAFT_513673 [Trichoderma harzianum CBS 226.95]